MSISGAGRAGPITSGRGTAELAAEVKALLRAGEPERARARFGDLVAATQRRASRVALYYLRDRADADDAVQDAFVKAFVNLWSFDETLSFDTWFGRILVNGCLDRIKARARRGRWMVETHGTGSDTRATPEPTAPEPSPEEAALRAERARALREAIETLPERQRHVVVLTQLDGRATSEVSQMTGLSESTIRVHLFRAMRRLRRVLAAGADEGH